MPDAAAVERRENTWKRRMVDVMIEAGMIVDRKKTGQIILVVNLSQGGITNCDIMENGKHIN